MSATNSALASKDPRHYVLWLVGKICNKSDTYVFGRLLLGLSPQNFANVMSELQSLGEDEDWFSNEYECAGDLIEVDTLIIYALLARYGLIDIAVGDFGIADVQVTRRGKRLLDVLQNDAVKNALSQVNDYYKPLF